MPWFLVLLLLLASPVWAGQLDASWTAPTTNVDGSPLTDLASYRLYWFLFPATPCPGTQFLVVPSATATPAPNTTVTKNLSGLTQGMTYNVQVTAVDAAGNESGCSSLASAVARADSPPPPPSPVVTFGETNVLPVVDSGNANLLIATQATLATAGTLTSLSFDVTTAAGSLRLGVYADANGAPGALVAQTAAFTPVVGWNTQAVTSPVPLVAGPYWLAYLASDNALAFPVDRTTTSVTRFLTVPFGPMPATFPTSGLNTTSSHWSLFGTVTTGAGIPPSPGTGLRLQFTP